MGKGGDKGILNQRIRGGKGEARTGVEETLRIMQVTGHLNSVIKKERQEGGGGV